MTQEQINQLVGAALPVIVGCLFWFAQTLTARNARLKLTAQAQVIDGKVQAVDTAQKAIDDKQVAFEQHVREVDLNVTNTLAEVTRDQLRQRTEHEEEMKRRDQRHIEALADLKKTMTQERDVALEALKSTLVKEHNGEMTTLKTEYEQQIKGLREQINTLQGSVDRLTKQLQGKQDELDAERSKNGTLQQRIDEQQEQIDTLQRRVTELETKKPDTGNLDPSKVPPDPAPETPIE